MVSEISQQLRTNERFRLLVRVLAEKQHGRRTTYVRVLRATQFVYSIMDACHMLPRLLVEAEQPPGTQQTGTLVVGAMVRFRLFVSSSTFTLTIITGLQSLWHEVI